MSENKRTWWQKKKEELMDFMDESNDVFKTGYAQGQIIAAERKKKKQQERWSKK